MANDRKLRSKVIHIAASMPKNSDERKALLGVLAAETRLIHVMRQGRPVDAVKSDVAAGDLLRYKGREYQVFRNVRDPSEFFIRLETPVY